MQPLVFLFSAITLLITTSKECSRASLPKFTSRWKCLGSESSPRKSGTAPSSTLLLRISWILPRKRMQTSSDHIAAIIAKSKKVPVTNYLKFYNVLHWASLCYCNLQLPRYQLSTSTPSSIRCNLRISVIMCKVNLFTVKRVFFSSSGPTKIFFLFVILHHQILETIRV